MILPDVLQGGLRVVFCGTAVGTRSAKVRAYYAGPGNSFWATLHQIGLTPRQLRPAEYAELPQYGIGLTDLCKVTAGSDSEVGTGGFDIPQLEAKLDQYRPGWIAFNGKTAAKAALGRRVDYGAQRERLGSDPSIRASFNVGCGAWILGSAVLAPVSRDHLTPSEGAGLAGNLRPNVRAKPDRPLLHALDRQHVVRPGVFGEARADRRLALRIDDEQSVLAVALADWAAENDEALIGELHP